MPTFLQTLTGCTAFRKVVLSGTMESARRLFELDAEASLLELRLNVLSELLHEAFHMGGVGVPAAGGGRGRAYRFSDAKRRALLSILTTMCDLVSAARDTMSLSTLLAVGGGLDGEVARHLPTQVPTPGLGHITNYLSWGLLHGDRLLGVDDADTNIEMDVD